MKEIDGFTQRGSYTVHSLLFSLIHDACLQSVADMSIFGRAFLPSSLVGHRYRGYAFAIGIGFGGLLWPRSFFTSAF